MNLPKRSSSPDADVLTLPSTEVRQRVHELVHWLGETHEQVSQKLVELAELCRIVRDFRLWAEWVCAETGRRYESFHQWLKAEVGANRSVVYRLLAVADRAALNPPTMRKLGLRGCLRLAQVARHDPGKARELVRRLEAGENLQPADIDQAIAEVATGKPKAVWIEVAVDPETAERIETALLVENVLDPVEQPETPWGRGQLLYGICEEYLSGEEQIRVLETLRKARRKARTAATPEG
jgi:hypothetical protein